MTGVDGRRTQKTLITFPTIDATLSAVEIEISKLYTNRRSAYTNPNTQQTMRRSILSDLCSMINKFSS